MSQRKQHVCPICGEGTCEARHLCMPGDLQDETCDWCGALIVNQRHMCHEKLEEVAYICQSCGRTAVAAEYRCEPERIG